MRILTFSFVIFGSITARATQFTYHDLVALIQTRQLKSVESVLENLPQNLRSSYTLMRRSRSLQDASDLYPRAILYGDTAQLTCAFNGDSNAAGYDTLECFQFVSTERRFDFRQIQFPTQSNGLQQVQFSESGKSADGRISCSSCHAVDPRPNWDSYPVWPGAYGQYGESMSSDEIAAYKKFEANRPNHSRYKWLNGGSEGRSNIRLSALLSRLSAYRAARLLESKLPRWAALGWAVGGLGCQFTDTQIQSFKKAGLDYLHDTSLHNLFDATKLTHYEWTPQILKDPYQESYVFQYAGAYTHLVSDLAMAIVREEADAGNVNLREVIAEHAAFVQANPIPNDYYARFGSFFVNLDSILHGPIFFGGYPQYTNIVQAACPEVTAIFGAEYLSHRSP